MAAAQRLATTTSIDLAVARAHSAKRTAAQTPIQRTDHHRRGGYPGLRTYVQLFVVIATANDVHVRRRVELDVRLRLRVRRGHRRHPRAVRQPGRADGEGVRRLHRHRSAPARRPTITARLNFQLAFGARVGQRLGEAREQAKQDRQGRRTRPGHRDCAAQQGHRVEAPLPRRVEGAWHLAGHQRDRRLFVLGATGRRSGGAARATGRHPEFSGARTRAGAVRSGDPRLPTRQGLRRGGFVRTLFDRAAEHGYRRSTSSAPSSRSRRRAGSPRWMPSSATWPTCWPCPPCATGGRPSTAVTVRARRGATCGALRVDADAHDRRTRRRHRWALRELVVLHEIAHHCVPVEPATDRSSSRRSASWPSGDGPRGRSRAAGGVRQGGRAATVRGRVSEPDRQALDELAQRAAAHRGRGAGGRAAAASTTRVCRAIEVSAAARATALAAGADCAGATPGAGDRHARRLQHHLRWRAPLGPEGRVVTLEYRARGTPTSRARNFAAPASTTASRSSSVRRWTRCRRCRRGEPSTSSSSTPTRRTTRPTCSGRSSSRRPGTRDRRRQHRARRPRPRPGRRRPPGAGGAGDARDDGAPPEVGHRRDPDGGCQGLGRLRVGFGSLTAESVLVARFFAISVQ